MDNLELKCFPLGDLTTNAYLIIDKNTNQACLIDAPSPAKEIKEFIEEKGLNLLFILLTHGHFDHIGGLSEFSEEFFIHLQDKDFITDPGLNGSHFFGFDCSLRKTPKIYQGSLRFAQSVIEVIHTPGHTPGGVSLRLEKWLFSGDTLFYDSVGRSDIPLASHDILINSITSKLIVLPDETLVYPGHGRQTSIGREKKYNPFL